jgi:SAM-dependent methyltransferase
LTTVSGFVTRSPLTDQREFWEAGGIYRPSTHPVVELFARQRVHHLERTGLLVGVRSLLDVGAGSGFSSAYYPAQVALVACDYAAGMLAENPVRDRVRASAYALPFRDRAFDAVSCWELLHHLDEPVRAVAEMLRVARRRVVVFEPNRINPGHVYLGLTREEERQSLRFSPGHLRRIVAAAGGRIVGHVRCGLLFPNITPLSVARVLVRLPYRVPLLGISQLVVAEKAGGAAAA